MKKIKTEKGIETEIEIETDVTKGKGIEVTAEEGTEIPLYVR